MTRHALGADLGFEPFDDCFVIDIAGKGCGLSDFSPQLLKDLAAFLGYVITIVAGEESFTATMLEKAVDGWNLAQQMCHGFGHELIQICTSKGRIQHEQGV